MDEYQVRTWHGWHHHMALSLMAVWFLIGETHRGQQLTPALTLPQVRYGLSLLLLEVFCTSGTQRVALHLTVVTSTTVPSGVSGYARDAHVAWGVSSAAAAHETPGVPGSSNNDW